MKRRILALLLTICLVIPMLSVTANAAITISAATGANVVTTGRREEKTLNINWNHIAQVGNQNSSSSVACGCYALAYCRTILDGTPRTWNMYNANAGSESNACAYWSKGNYSINRPNSRNAVFVAAYNSINSGRPIILYVTGKNSSGRNYQHYVAVVGYTGVTNTASMSESNFLFIDAVPGATKSRVENLGMCSRSYKLRTENGKYKYMSTNKGTVSTNDSSIILDNSFATISGQNAPSSLTKGKTYSIKGTISSSTYSIKGTISSSTKITSVTAGVYTSQSGGTKKTGSSAKPNRTSYNLANLDPYVYFNKLDAGTYYYRVTATNSAGTATLINSKFTVVSPVTNNNSSYATISGANAPSTLKPGQTYSITGSISSKTRITAVTAGVYTSNSGTNMVTGKTVRPNSTSYNLKNVDRYVYFNRLSTGTYYYIVKATNSAGTKTLINQKFTVTNSVAGNWGTLTPKCAPRTRLDVDNAGTGDGVNVQIYGSNGTNAQKWRLVDLGNGYYAIQSRVSGKCLDVAGGKTTSGTNVQQYSWNSSNAQQWKLISAGSGYYYICPRLNLNLCLDVSGGGSANGTNVCVYTRNNTNAQRWCFN